MKLATNAKLKVLLWITLLTSSVFGEPMKVIRPEQVRSSEATYTLLKSFLQKNWSQIAGSENIAFPPDPLPVFRLQGRCYSDVLLILPFERLLYPANEKQINGRSTGITKGGSRVLIYGMDFQRQRIVLLFDGLLVDFHGALTSANGCPHLLVTVLDSTFTGRAPGVGFSQLKFNSQQNVFKLEGKEVFPNP